MPIVQNNWVYVYVDILREYSEFVRCQKSMERQIFIYINDSYQIQYESNLFN